jgi:hypothetical protein
MTRLQVLALSAGTGSAAAGNACGERDQGEASDQGAAVHDALGVFMETPMPVL